MLIYTIGFTQKSAEQFFETIAAHKIQQLIDVRLNNTSQLSAFAKRTDLEYFLGRLCDASYLHSAALCPTQEMLDRYKKSNGSWDEYAAAFLNLLKSRQVESVLAREMFQLKTVLLCSENSAHHCHRRLVIDYLNQAWGDVQATHL